MSKLNGEIRMRQNNKSAAVGLLLGIGDVRAALRRFSVMNPARAVKPMTRAELTDVCADYLCCLPPKAARNIAVWMAGRAIQENLVTPVAKIWVDDEQQFRIKK